MILTFLYNPSHTCQNSPGESNNRIIKQLYSELMKPLPASPHNARLYTISQIFEEFQIIFVLHDIEVHFNSEVKHKFGKMRKSSTDYTIDRNIQKYKKVSLVFYVKWCAVNKVFFCYLVGEGRETYPSTLHFFTSVDKLSFVPQLFDTI